jgi:hypothetical protein
MRDNKITFKWSENTATSESHVLVRTFSRLLSGRSLDSYLVRRVKGLGEILAELKDDQAWHQEPEAGKRMRNRSTGGRKLTYPLGMIQYTMRS